MADLVVWQPGSVTGTIERSEKIGIPKLTVPPSLVDTINPNTFLHLLDLKADQSCIGVTVAMIFDQESDSLFVTAVGHEPTRGLRNKPNRYNDNDTGKALADERNAPLVVAVDLFATKCDHSSGNGATIPTTVVET